MTLTEFAELVVEMRKAQRDYFKTPTAEALAHSMILERKVDAVLKSIGESKKPNLFSGQEVQ